MSGFTAVGFFLISVLFGLISTALWLRVALRYLRISTLNPFSQLVCSLTDPLINPLNKYFKQKINARFEWVTLGLLILVSVIKIICISLLSLHFIMPIPYFILYVVADLMMQPMTLLFYAVLIRVIMSYANPGWRHPAADFLYQITEPLLIMGRRIVPDISGFDFSPIVVLMILKICTLFISNSLPGRLL